MFGKHIYDKGLVSNIYEELVQSNKGKNIFFSNGQKILTDTLPKKIQMANKHMKRYSAH